MSSLRKILAARANGARSRGPVTPAGKQRSSRNAITHGLLARTTLLEGESPEALAALLDEHVDRLRPADGVEFGMVQEMVAAHWRLRRAWAIESRALENEIAAQPTGDQLDRMAAAFDALASKPAAHLLHRYQTRLHNMYYRALQNLLLLRLAVPNEPNAVPAEALPPSDDTSSSSDDNA